MAFICGPTPRTDAVMEVEDGHSMELLIRLPAALPLLPPEVSCQKKVGGPGGCLGVLLVHMSRMGRAPPQLP